MTVKDVVKQICDAGRFTKGSPEAKAVHNAFIGVYGSEYHIINDLRHSKQVENKLYSHPDHSVVNRIMPHVRDVIRKLK